jgi:hypothetical protein
MANAHHEEFEEFRSVFPSARDIQSRSVDIPSYKLEPIRSICTVRYVYLGGFDSATCQHAQFLTRI